ncbi:MAG: hypothetical protein V1793_03415 [Pseudomonadota bacterium]
MRLFQGDNRALPGGVHSERHDGTRITARVGFAWVRIGLAG